MGGAPVDILSQPFRGRRTVYGFVDRQNLPGTFLVFDLASPDISCPRRHATTVPQQALFLMNNPFVLEMARRLAERPEVAGAKEARERIRALYRLLFQRAPREREEELALHYLEKAAPADGKPDA